MARGVNRVTLIGNVGGDPETKFTQGGMAITSLSLATTRVRKDKDGNQVEDTQWHRVKFFGKLAEIVGEYVKKGRQLYVEGSIKYDKFTGSDGVEKYFTDIIGDEMQLLGSDGQREGGEQSRPQQSRPAARPARQPPPEPTNDDFEDSEIPF